MAIFYPASFPIAACLDKLLGPECAGTFSKAQMKRVTQLCEDEDIIKKTSGALVQSVLSLEDKTISCVMKPINELFMVEINALMNDTTLRLIYSKGYSRIPVYEKDRRNVVGILMTRDLVLINPN